MHERLETGQKFFIWLLTSNREAAHCYAAAWQVRTSVAFVIVLHTFRSGRTALKSIVNEKKERHAAAKIIIIIIGRQVSVRVVRRFSNHIIAEAKYGLAINKRSE